MYYVLNIIHEIIYIRKYRAYVYLICIHCLLLNVKHWCEIATVIISSLRGQSGSLIQGFLTANICSFWMGVHLHAGQGWSLRGNLFWLPSSLTMNPDSAFVLLMATTDKKYLRDSCKASDVLENPFPVSFKTYLFNCFLSNKNQMFGQLARTYLLFCRIGNSSDGRTNLKWSLLSGLREASILLM